MSEYIPCINVGKKKPLFTKPYIRQARVCTRELSPLGTHLVITYKWCESQENTSFFPLYQKKNIEIPSKSPRQ